MRRFLLLLPVLLLACDGPEETIAKLGGPEPVLCVYRTPKYNKLWACRDGAGGFWICSGTYCMPTTYPAELFAPK